jgi:uncharacterized protein (DUF362 family)
MADARRAAKEAASSAKSGSRGGAARRGNKSKPVKVSVLRQPGINAFGLLEQCLERAGFWQHIKTALVRSRVRRDRFRIIIKPDLDFFAPGVPGGTDPALVEHVIDLLHDRELPNVVVGDGRNVADTWLYNRDPLVVPELIGYRFVTQKGRPYELVSLQDDVSSAREDGPDTVGAINRHWAAANYRINFAKLKTHEEFFFALCIHNLVGLITRSDQKDRWPPTNPADASLGILRTAPPHFNIIDAFRGCHGGAGHRAFSVMETRTFIASADALLADWAGAAKMGLDPYASPINNRALRQIGLPASHELDGDLAPYPLWRNVHPLVASSARYRSRSVEFGRIVEPWFQTVDRESFPFKEFYNDRINSFISPLMAQLDANQRSFWIIIFLNYVIGKVGSFVLSQQTMFAKNKLQRRSMPLEINPAAYDLAVYEAIPLYLRPYEQLLESFPADQSGQRWRHLDGSVLFSGSHSFPIDYEAFVRRVDITRSIQYMNDYIGGATQPVRRDGRRRLTHQAERNIYLQQPNWIVLFGGEMIDVEKLELIEYKPDRQTIYWRTVASPNTSAAYDDGSVSFLRSGAGETTVRIFARQQFSLPLFFQIFDVNKVPEIRNPIIERAYATFFAGTMANLQAVFEGRDFRIGQDAEAADHARMRELPRYLATAVTAVAELLRHRKDVANFSEWLFRAETGSAELPGHKETDRDGFQHFSPATASHAHPVNGRDEQAVIAGLAALVRDAPDIVTGLFEAVRNDLDRMANAAGGGSGS